MVVASLVAIVYKSVDKFCKLVKKLSVCFAMDKDQIRVRTLMKNEQQNVVNSKVLYVETMAVVVNCVELGRWCTDSGDYEQKLTSAYGAICGFYVDLQWPSEFLWQIDVQRNLKWLSIDE
eukprot:Gb_21408 [translate_table: standard]